MAHLPFSHDLDPSGEPNSPDPGSSRATERNLRNGFITLAVFSLLAIGLLLAVPGLRAAEDRIADANPLWIVLAIVLEALSCAGYVVLFELVFGKIAGRLRARLPLS